ncbi:MAG: hypothetical protein COZ04_05825, partial [Candidatus Aenigmarchaeota archaeon CG_4_10_14_3_um_filter_37_21]
MLKIDEIKKYYIFMFLTGVNFIEAIYMLFLLSIGLNYVQILMTQAIFAFIMFLSQIPAGILSDLWSRKKVIILGSFIGIISAFVYANSTSFIQVVIAEALIALAITFAFSTLTPFGYEVIIENKKEHASKKIFSKATSCLLLGGIIGPFVGAYIAGNFGLKMGMLSNVFSWLLIFLVSLTLRNPKAHRAKERNSFNQISSSFKLLKMNPLLIYLIINFTFLNLFSWLTLALIQPYFENIRVGIIYIGIIFSGANLIGAITTNFSDRIEKKFGIRRSVFSSGVLIALGMLMIGLFKLPSIVILGFLMTRTMSRFREPLFSDYFNKLIGSDKRATIISFSGFLYWFFYGVLGLFLGYLIEGFGLGKIFIGFALVSIVVILFTK